MKKFVVALAILSVAITPAASALDTLDPVRLGIIQQRCALLQTVLGQLQRSDLVARTNRGREYESTVKQLDALTQRLRHNNISTATLDPSVTGFKTTLEAFRIAYIEYDNGITQLQQIDCRTQPVEFANQLERTSIMRQSVGAEVAKGETQLANYRAALVTLQSGLPAAQNGGAQ